MVLVVEATLVGRRLKERLRVLAHKCREVTRTFHSFPQRSVGVATVLGDDVMLVFTTDEQRTTAVEVVDIRQFTLLDEIIDTSRIVTQEHLRMLLGFVSSGGGKEQHNDTFRHLLFSKKRTTHFRPSEVRSEILQQN